MANTNGHAAVDLEDPQLVDDKVVEHLAGLMPPAARLAFGEMVRDLIKTAIRRERRRCQFQLAAGSRYNERQVAQIEGQIQAAILAGRSVDALAMRRAEQVAMARALAAAVAVVGRDPGGCGRCGGTKMIPASLALPGGQRPLLPCPACNTQELAGDQEGGVGAGGSETAASSSSNGVTSSSSG